MTAASPESLVPVGRVEAVGAAEGVADGAHEAAASPKVNTRARYLRFI